MIQQPNPIPDDNTRPVRTSSGVYEMVPLPEKLPPPPEETHEEPT